MNNAGFGSYGAIEDVSMVDAHYQLEVNLYGAARLIQLVLPKMRENGFGKIVNISSVGGRIAGPMGGWYHASKFALEGLSDSLRNEVKQFGIDVVVIRPGATKTEWGDIVFKSLLKTSGNTAYKKLAHKIHRAFTAMGKNAVDVGKVANVIVKSIEARHPRTRYACDSAGRLILLLRKILSDKQLDRLYMNQIK